MYPYIDPGTGGKITGMIAAADKIISLADNDTKIVAGHDPLGKKADLTRFQLAPLSRNCRGRGSDKPAHVSKSRPSS